jgi:hypothetical protein
MPLDKRLIKGRLNEIRLNCNRSTTGENHRVTMTTHIWMRETALWIIKREWGKIENSAVNFITIEEITTKHKTRWRIANSYGIRGPLRIMIIINNDNEVIIIIRDDLRSKRLDGVYRIPQSPYQSRRRKNN